MTDFEKKIKDSKQEIKSSSELNPSEIYKMAQDGNTQLKETKKKTGFSIYNPKVKLALGILIIAIVFTFGFFLAKGIFSGNKVYVNNPTGNLNVNIENNVNDKQELTSFSNFASKEELYEYLNEEKSLSTVSSRTKSSGDLEFTDEAQAPGISGVPTSTSDSSASTYQTNTQVENVDEADIVKVSGNHIFYLPNEAIYSYDAFYYSYNNDNKRNVYLFTEENNKLVLSKTIEFSTTREVLKEEDGNKLINVINMIPQDLYVTDKYLIVRIDKTEYKTIQKNESTNYYYSTYDYAYTSLYQIYDINNLNLVKTFETAGTNVSTRLIGNTLYIINNYNDYLYNNRFFYPYYLFDDVVLYPELNCIYCSNNKEIKTYVSIYKLVLNDEIEFENLHVLIPSVNNIYSTTKNIYLIRSYGNEIIKEEKQELTYNKSDVTVINIENGLKISGNFVVKGSINDKYWIDEKDDYIRVVTTGRQTVRHYIDQKYYYDYSSSIFNHLTIFKKTEEGFTETASITEGIGKPGETIRSARFNGDVVTIVTFKNVDPIYYVDISNPDNPVISSNYEISGYSVYQHPYKDNYVIGFGYEVENNRTVGYKITLFDVSDKENIKAVGNSYVIKSSITNNLDGNNYREIRYTPEIFNDPKSLFADNVNGIYGFSLSGYAYNYSLRNFINKYLVFTIDENSKNPIQVKELASTINQYSINGVRNPINYDNYYQRLVFIGDNYYLLSKTKVNCYNIENNEFVEKEEIALSL